MNGRGLPFERRELQTAEGGVLFGEGAHLPAVDGVGPPVRLHLQAGALLRAGPRTHHLAAMYDSARIGHRAPYPTLQRFVRLQDDAVALVEVGVVRG